MTEKSNFEWSEKEKSVNEVWEEAERKQEQEERDSNDIQEMLSVYRKLRHNLNIMAEFFKLLWRWILFWRKVP